MINDVLSLLSPLLDYTQLRQDILQEIQSGQIGVILLPQVDGHIIDEVI